MKFFVFQIYQKTFCHLHSLSLGTSSHRCIMFYESLTFISLEVACVKFKQQYVHFTIKSLKIPEDKRTIQLMISLEYSQKHKFSPSHQLSYPTVCWVMLYLNQYKEVITKIAKVKTEWNMNSNTKLHCPIQQPLALKRPLDTCGYLNLIKNLAHWLYQLNFKCPIAGGYCIERPDKEHFHQRRKVLMTALTYTCIGRCPYFTSKPGFWCFLGGKSNM